MIFYGDWLQAHQPTSNLEDHPLSAVRDCLFNIFAGTLQIWRPFLYLYKTNIFKVGANDALWLKQNYLVYLDKYSS